MQSIDDHPWLSKKFPVYALNASRKLHKSYEPWHLRRYFVPRDKLSKQLKLKFEEKLFVKFQRKPINKHNKKRQLRFQRLVMRCMVPWMHQLTILKVFFSLLMCVPDLFGHFNLEENIRFKLIFNTRRAFSSTGLDVRFLG